MRVSRKVELMPQLFSAHPGYALMQLPYVIKSPQAGGQGWRSHWGRARLQRQSCAVAVSVFLAALVRTRGTPKAMRLVRFAPRALDPANIGRALKHFEDAIFDVIHAKCVEHKRRPCGHYHDGPTSGVAVTFSQVVSPAYGLRVELEWEDLLESPSAELCSRLDAARGTNQDEL